MALKAFRRLGPYLFNTNPGIMERHQRAKPKPKPKPPVASLVNKALGTANLFATPQKSPTVVATSQKSPRKRGRPRKNPVAVTRAPLQAPVLALKPEPLFRRTGRKIKVLIPFRC